MHADPYGRAVLGSGSAAARLLGLQVWIPHGIWMSVYFECCVLTGRDLCFGPITRPEELRRMWRVWAWSWKPQQWWGPDTLGAVAHWKKKGIHNKGHSVLWYGNINSEQNSLLAASCSMNPSVVDWIWGSAERNCWLTVWTLTPNVTVSVHVSFDISLICRGVWCRL